MCHATEVEYGRRMREVLCPKIYSESGMVDFSRCSFPHPFRSFLVIREGNARGTEFDSKVSQCAKNLLIGLHNIELFAALQTRSVPVSMRQQRRSDML